jgi:hypothetical protein
MARADRRRLVRGLRRDALRSRPAGDLTMELTLGPAPSAYTGDWPAIEARLLRAWNERREAIMAIAAPDRPWAWWWYDRPHPDSQPGPIRDGHLTSGRMTPSEAALMGRAHTWHALGRIAATRPAQGTTDWLADPALIESSTALLGWNPFTPEVIAYLRATYPPQVAEQA